MPAGMIFWVLMILWFVFGLWMNWPKDNTRPYGLGGHILQFILFFLVGWKLFGFVVQ